MAETIIKWGDYNFTVESSNYGLVTIYDEEGNPLLIRSTKFHQNPKKILDECVEISKELDAFLADEKWEYENIATLDDKNKNVVITMHTTINGWYDGEFEKTISLLKKVKHSKELLYRTDVSLLELVELAADGKRDEIEARAARCAKEENDYRYMVAIESRAW